MRRALRASSTGRRSRGGHDVAPCRRGRVTSCPVPRARASQASRRLAGGAHARAGERHHGERGDGEQARPVTAAQIARRDPPLWSTAAAFRVHLSRRDEHRLCWHSLGRAALSREAGSLKGKRKELLSVKAQLQRRFGASVAEVDHHELWQRARLDSLVRGPHAQRRRRPARRGRAVPGRTGVRAGPPGTGGGHA